MTTVEVILLILAFITGIFGFTGLEINIMNYSTIEISKILFYVFAALFVIVLALRLIRKK